MIQKMSHAAIFVLDQDQAKDFYVGKLGFDVKVDATLPNGFRWLTVAPKAQSDLEIILMKVGKEFEEIKTGHATKADPKDVDALIALIRKGMLGAGAFHTSDCRKTFAELRAKGVEFISEPKEQFYGVEAVFKDPFGNWFSMTQPKNG